MTRGAAAHSPDTDPHASPGPQRAVLDTDPGDVHSALVPPGALHHQVTAALSTWRLADAEQLLSQVGIDPSPYAGGPDTSGGPYIPGGPYTSGGTVGWYR